MLILSKYLYSVFLRLASACLRSILICLQRKIACQQNASSPDPQNLRDNFLRDDQDKTRSKQDVTLYVMLYVMLYAMLYVMLYGTTGMPV